MTDSQQLVRASKRLSWLLRHAQPSREGITMDTEGWVALDDVERVLGLSQGTILEVCETNVKKRFELEEGRIRAAQGHSRSVVSPEDIERTWEPFRGSGLLWHGTSVSSALSIAGSRISAMNRTHVHLSVDLESRVGKRASVDVMLGVSPEALRASGIRVFLSANGVALCRYVPSGCIVDVRSASRAGHRNLNRICEAFGIEPGV